MQIILFTKKFMRLNMVLQQLDLKLPGLSINIVM